MKKVFYLATLAVMASACNLGNSYRISGHIDNGEGQWLYLERMDLSKNVRLDSVKLGEKGTFRFRGKGLTEPTFFRLAMSPSNFITLLADSTEHIDVKANARHLEDSYNVQHSLGSGYVKILNRKIRITKHDADSLATLYSQLPESAWVLKKQVEEQYLRVIDAHKKFIGSFVMENPRSFASYYALFLEMNNAPVMNVMDKKDQVFFKTIATSLNLLYPGSERSKHLYSYVQTALKMQKQQQMTQMLLENAKSGIPNIEIPTPSGQMVSLESLRGKVVLLSYWASFDQNSRHENQNLKRLYARYKSKGFEIYQVSLDQSRVLWENAILQDGCEWISVSDLQASNSYAARIYNVNSIPANYLISRNGDIIGKDLFGSRLEEKLSEILR
ncbi:MAG: TlpA disulfide reductase family protein [Breznakibacter sp.]